MQIVITEVEIKEAIINYVAKQGITVTGKVLQVDLTAGRCNGHTATIEITEQEDEPIGLELGVNTMQEPFTVETIKPEPEKAPAVKRTRRSKAEMLADAKVEEAAKVEPEPETVTVTEETEEENPFELDETSAIEPFDPEPAEEPTLETDDTGVLDTESLFA